MKSTIFWTPPPQRSTHIPHHYSSSSKKYITDLIEDIHLTIWLSTGWLADLKELSEKKE